MAGIERDTAADKRARPDVDLSRVTTAMLGAPDLTTVLQQIVELATLTIEGCDFAGIFLRAGESVTTLVHTHPIAKVIDELQQSIGQGPCLDAIARRTTVYAGDLTDDAHWSGFGPAAIEAGVRSVLALQLAGTEDPLGALNLYSRYTHAFGVIDRGQGLILATIAEIALGSARQHADDQRRIDNLSGALATREVIGQAQGILMERERLSADQAFDVLRRSSQHLNRKLREVAQDLVDTGEHPDTGSRSLS